MNRSFKFLSLLLIAVFLLSACAPKAIQPAVVDPTAVPVVEATAVPTAEPTAATASANELILATTTSTQDSGLLDYLLPMFEKETGITVKVIAVGTGQALQMGVDGNADVLLVHSRAKEDEFMANGDGIRREDVMYNDFVVVGPEADPASIKGISTAVEAFAKIAAAKAVFISRGDDSGTHTKEKGIWTKAEITPEGDWYISSGQGMGEVLTMAEEMGGYTLSDRATYLARTKTGLKLQILVEGEKGLFNPYGVIAVNPAKGPQIKNDLANTFIDWIVSVPVQEKIASFGKEDFGQSLFTPSSELWNKAQAAQDTSAILKVTGAVAEPKQWTETEIRAMDKLDVKATNNSGKEETYTGFLVKTFIELAKPNAGATTVVFVAEDGSTVEAPLADILASANGIIAFRSNGGLRTVFPDMDSKMQVKGLVEIQIK